MELKKFSPWTQNSYQSFPSKEEVPLYLYYTYR